MTVTLDTLDLTPAELEASKEIVRRMAYFNWLDAGAPDGSEYDCWLRAERQWIEQYYVPSRPFDGWRPPVCSATAPDGGDDRRQAKRDDAWRSKRKEGARRPLQRSS